jgi:hypothetical protein
MSIISGTGAAIWSKTTGYHHHQSSLISRICTIVIASAIIELILEVVFLEGVQQHCSSPLITSFVSKWRALFWNTEEKRQRLYCHITNVYASVYVPF